MLLTNRRKDMDQKPTPLSGNKHLSLQEKRKIVDEWKKSGLSKHEFCKERGVITTTFYGWCKQAARAGDRAENNPLAPVAVVKKSSELHGGQTGEAEAEIFLPNQAIVRLRTPVETLIAVIRGLSDASHTAG